MTKNSTPKISVVIPACNEEKKIKRCLEGLQKQNFKSDFEIIVVDNASTDNTAKIAGDMGVKVIKEENRGVAFARQAGFKEAQADIIASTDADTLVPSDWLQTIHEAMEDTRLVGVMGTFLFYDRGKIWNMLTKIITPIILLIDWVIGWGGNHFLGMNFAVRKEAFLKSGGFTTNLKYGEDIDLAKKVKKYGRIAYVKKMRVQTHSRRYQLNLAFAKYVVNFIKTDITGKPFRNELPRVERKIKPGTKRE